MSGISHLYDLYNKKGKDFIDNLFNSYVTVNEKMDGSAFIFERDMETGKFNFYKRDQRNPITLVDRTLMKYYEKPIQYIESLPPHILNDIPRGWRFGMEYFANNAPVEIVYDEVPKNNLILSYVHKKDNSGKSKGTIQEKSKLDTWADLLGVERPPIVFQGYLTTEQKEGILDFLRTPFEDLLSEYKTRSFVAFIIGVLNPELKKTALNYDLDKPIEGIVFRFGEEESEQEPILSKMVDPVFTELAKGKAKKRTEEKPSDFLGITILDVMNFILENGVNTFEVEGKTEDERYISFISDVFTKFLDDYGYKYKGADFQEPEYLKKDEFRLNKSLITDKRVLRYLEEDDSFESLFKLMLNSFRKIKKRAGGIITAGIIDQFNSVVSTIEKRVEDSDKKPAISESELPSFLDFKKNNLTTKKIEYVTEDEDDSDDHFYSYNEFISTLETIDTTKKNIPKDLTEDNKSEDKKDLSDVNLLVGRFQPFHIGHLKMAKTLKEKNNLPSIVAVVHPGHNKSGKSPFNEDTVTKYMESVVKENPGVIDGYFIARKGLLGVIYGAAKELGYNVNLIGAGDDRMEDYKKQSEYLKKAGGDFPSDIEVIETPRSTSGTEIRDSIQKEDFLKFKKLVPSSVSSFYNTLVSAINGKAIAEFEEAENSEDISESKKADLAIKKEKRNSSKK
jgi:cytidyltransferase-like protein